MASFESLPLRLIIRITSVAGVASRLLENGFEDKRKTMDVFKQSDWVEIQRDSRKGLGGRGVFARRPIGEGTIFERAPVLFIPRQQVFDESNRPRRACRLSWYVYDWGNEDGEEYVVVALGYGSLYNHSYQSNAIYRMESPDTIEFVAVRNIEVNEEITINYNGLHNDSSPVELHPMQ